MDLSNLSDLSRFSEYLREKQVDHRIDCLSDDKVTVIFRSGRHFVEVYFAHDGVAFSSFERVDDERLDATKLLAIIGQR